MSEHEGESQAADVRSFLPRPGEPVEDYAARLRTLHHDLALAPDAAERGLPGGARPPPPREMSFDPPDAMSRRHRGPTLSPVLLAATVLGWLTVLALILALALD